MHISINDVISTISDLTDTYGKRKNTLLEIYGVISARRFWNRVSYNLTHFVRCYNNHDL
jgi:hypothetical protein